MNCLCSSPRSRSSLSIPVFVGLFVCLFVGCLLSSTLRAEVKDASSTGFHVSHTIEVELGPEESYARFVKDFSTWYDASHSYSGEGKNLSLDFEKACFLEKLPDGGFVRHMEIVYHQPGKMLRLTGGLGPLQGMGVAGALTFSFEPNAKEGAEETGEKHGTKVVMTYNVSGADFLQLNHVAAPVDQVLTSQLERFQSHCAAKGE